MKTHVGYLTLIAIVAMGLFFGFRTWLQEHDGRLLAQQQEKISEARIVDLQKQYDVLLDQAKQQKAQVIKIVQQVKTPTDAVAAIPQLTNAPLNARVSPDNPTQVSVDAIALTTELGSCKQDRIDLGACQAGLKLKDDQLVEKDKVIAALKKKPSLLKRVVGQMKTALFGAVAIEVIRLASRGVL